MLRITADQTLVRPVSSLTCALSCPRGPTCAARWRRSRHVRKAIPAERAAVRRTRACPRNREAPPPGGPRTDRSARSAYGWPRAHAGHGHDQGRVPTGEHLAHPEQDRGPEHGRRVVRHLRWRDRPQDAGEPARTEERLPEPARRRARPCREPRQDRAGGTSEAACRADPTRESAATGRARNEVRTARYVGPDQELGVDAGHQRHDSASVRISRKTFGRITARGLTIRASTQRDGQRALSDQLTDSTRDRQHRRHGREGQDVEEQRTPDEGHPLVRRPPLVRRLRRTARAGSRTWSVTTSSAPSGAPADRVEQPGAVVRAVRADEHREGGVDVRLPKKRRGGTEPLGADAPALTSTTEVSASSPRVSIPAPRSSSIRVRMTSTVPKSLSELTPSGSGTRDRNPDVVAMHPDQVTIADRVLSEQTSLGLGQRGRGRQVDDRDGGRLSGELVGESAHDEGAVTNVADGRDREARGVDVRKCGRQPVTPVALRSDGSRPPQPSAGDYGRRRS